MPIDFDALFAPFPASELDWRVGQVSKDKRKCTLLVYLTARSVMERLDKVCGVDGWEDSYTPLLDGGKLAGMVCTLRILDRDTGRWITKTDVSDVSDMEAVKGACSGALKRAAVKFGVGRYLYNIDGRRWYEVKDGWPPSGSNAVYVPVGTKDEQKPGHIFPPTLPAEFLPPPPEPEKRKKESDQDKAARQEQHHESWSKDQPKFNAKLAELGFEYDEVCAWFAWLGKPRPSHVEQKVRNVMLNWLASTEGADSYNEYLQAKGTTP